MFIAEKIIPPRRVLSSLQYAVGYVSGYVPDIGYHNLGSPSVAANVIRFGISFAARSVIGKMSPSPRWS
jgi:hypothetical protein